MRSEADFQTVKAMLDTGQSVLGVSRATAIPRATVRRWQKIERRRGWVRRSYAGWRPPHPLAYAYLLGMYLGDGHITFVKSPFMTISLDAKYPELVDEACSSLHDCFPTARVTQRWHAVRRLVVVQMSHPALLDAFPQHGRGRKHLRPIVLADWQRKITHEHPEALLRGLIHSDGSRCLNRFKTKLPSGRVAAYAYPRYFFTNYSADIRGIFCEHCDLLGIRWTQSNPRNISVSHRHSVAKLDEFVGPKS